MSSSVSSPESGREPEPAASQTAPSATPSTPPEPQKKKRSWRRIFIIGATCIVALAVIGRVVIAVAFPHVLKKVASAYDLDVSYSRMELYLLGADVGLWDLTIHPRGVGGEPLMTTEYARGDVSALNLLRGKLVVRRAELDGASFNVRREADGSIPSLEKVLAAWRASRRDAGPTELSLDPPLRIDALRVNQMRAHLVDSGVSPTLDTELELTLRLSDVGVPGRPARLLLEGSSPTMLDTLRVEGTANAQRNRVDGNFNFLARGLHPRPATGYLARMGIRAVADNITLGGAMEVKLGIADGAAPAATAARPPAHVSGTVTLSNISAVADGRESAGIDDIVIEADAVGGTAARLTKLAVDGVRISASRTAEGNLRFAGLELAAPVPSTQPVSAVAAAGPGPTVVPSATQPGEAPLSLTLGGLTVRNLRAVFRDDAVMPAAELAFVVDELAVTGIDSEQPDSAALITGAFSSPGMAESIRLEGTTLPFASKRTLDAKIVAQGIRPDAIRAYLDALGIESTFVDGALTCEVRAAVGVEARGVLRADARLVNISLADGAHGELLALDSAGVSGASVYPDGSRVRVDLVELSGPRFAARRTADGTISALGLRSKPPAPARSEAPGSARVTGSAVGGADAAQSPMPRFELGRLTWNGVDVQLIDEAVTPASHVRLNNAGVELADVVVDLDPRAKATVTPGKVRAWFAAPGVADALNVEGTVMPGAGSVTADLSVTGEGLRGDLLAPYLKQAGVEPALRDGSLQLRTRVSLTRTGRDAIAASLAVEALRYADGEQELVGLDHFTVDAATLTGDGIAIESVQMDKPRARVQRHGDGSLTLAGVRVNLPSTRPVTAAADTTAPGMHVAAPASTQPVSAPFVVTVGKLRIGDGSIAWADGAVTPAVNTVGRANVEVDAFVYGRDAAPAAVRVVGGLDEVLERVSASGVLSASMTAPMVRLEVNGSGLREGVLRSYLPPDLTLAVRDGRFRATLEAGIAPHAEGGRSAKLLVSGVDYRDGEATEPLLSFDSARVVVSRADVPGKIIAIDEVSLAALETGARKAADGSIHALGVKFGSAAPEEPRAKLDAPIQPPPRGNPVQASPPLTTQPSGTSDVNALIAAGREKFPLVTLKTLEVNVRRASFVDESKPKSAPVALADVVLRNRAPIELLGDDPQSRPPVDLELVGKVDPLVGQFTVTTQVAPFASQPTLNVAINASGINGTGITAIVPELREQIDGSSLTDGRFTATLEASAKVAKRGPTQFDFTRPMEVTAVVRDVAFRPNGSSNAPVLAGVQEVRADGVRVDPATGSVIARSVEILQPTARAWRDAEGIHALGLLIKVPTTQPLDTPVTRPVRPADEPKYAAVIPASANAGNDGRASAVGTAKPQAELSIEKLTVSGIDVMVEDRSVAPPLIVPLNTLEAEVRGLSNMVFHEPRPIRFNVTMGAAKVPLAADKPPREMFSEIATSGNVTLYPSPRGWARSTMSGVELLSLKGPAAASDVTIEGGSLDSRVDLRFLDDGSIRSRSRFAFTNLRMSEAEDGPIRRVLKLPGPLDAMIIVLEDPSGAITLPLNVTVEEGTVGDGQLAGAAVTALGSILTTAMASAPLKMTGGVTQLVGLDQALPIFGKKKQTGPREVGAVDFYAGAGDAASDSASLTLRQLIEQMRRDKTLEVTLRHDLGGGDIALAEQRANPPPETAAALGESLRQRRAWLKQQRDQLAPAVRAMIVAGSAPSAADAITQLRELEAQLAATENALDRAYDLTRPESYRQAERRTRAASLEIAEARLEALKQMIVAARIPDAENRVRIVKPQFALADGDEGGTVTMVVVSKKKP